MKNIYNIGIANGCNPYNTEYYCAEVYDIAGYLNQIGIIPNKKVTFMLKEKDRVVSLEITEEEAKQMEDISFCKKIEIQLIKL